MPGSLVANLGFESAASPADAAIRALFAFHRSFMMTTPLPSLPFAPRPWGGLASFVDLHREMNRAFDNLFFNGGALLSSPLSLAQGAGSGLVDVQDDDNGVCVRVDMPGIKPTDLDVRLDGDMLTLSGRRQRTLGTRSGQDGQSVVRFESAVRLPFAPSPEAVQAELKDGVLTVQVPRDAGIERSRRIQVKAASGADASDSSSPQQAASAAQGSDGTTGESGFEGADGAQRGDVPEEPTGDASRSGAQATAEGE
jgi:HSP20 family protein